MTFVREGKIGKGIKYKMAEAVASTRAEFGRTAEGGRRAEGMELAPREPGQGGVAEARGDTRPVTNAGSGTCLRDKYLESLDSSQPGRARLVGDDVTQDNYAAALYIGLGAVAAV